MGPNGCVGGFVHGGHPGTIVFSWEPGYVNFKWNWADGRAEVKHPSLKESESALNLEESNQDSYTSSSSKFKFLDE